MCCLILSEYHEFLLQAKSTPQRPNLSCTFKMPRSRPKTVDSGGLREVGQYQYGQQNYTTSKKTHLDKSLHCRKWIFWRHIIYLFTTCRFCNQDVLHLVPCGINLHSLVFSYFKIYCHQYSKIPQTSRIQDSIPGDKNNLTHFFTLPLGTGPNDMELPLVIIQITV